jgi:hypothetical protein
MLVTDSASGFCGDDGDVRFFWKAAKDPPPSLSREKRSPDDPAQKMKVEPVTEKRCTGCCEWLTQSLDGTIRAIADAV